MSDQPPKHIFSPGALASWNAMDEAPAPSSLAATAGSAQQRIEIQNALRVLARVIKVDEEIIYCGNDLWLIRDHLYRSQEACELLAPNAPGERPGATTQKETNAN
jgi:hypothetical protein